MRAKLVAANVGQAQELQYKELVFQSAVFKQAVAAPVLLGERGLTGDTQVDKKYHGSPDQSICQYSLEHYPHWSAALGQELTYGAFGENFSTEGLLEDEVCVGDTYQVGEAIVQITEPRGPCNTLAARYNAPKLVKWVRQHGSTGFYCRTLQPGMVQAGDELVLLSRPAHGVTIREANLAMFEAKGDIALMERVLAAPELGREWRKDLKKRLASRRRKLTKQPTQAELVGSS